METRSYQNPMFMGSPHFHLSLRSISDIFGEMDFPQSRDFVFKYGRSHGADRTMLNQIEELPDLTFHSMDELTATLGAARRMPEARYLNPEDE